MEIRYQATNPSPFFRRLGAIGSDLAREEGLDPEVPGRAMSWVLITPWITHGSYRSILDFK